MESDFPISRFPDFPYRESWTQSSFILDPRPTTLVQSFSSRHDASHTSVVLVSVYHYFSLQIFASWRAWGSIV